MTDNQFREESVNNILNLKHPYILAELPTGFGKSKIAIDFGNKLQNIKDVLIVIPRLTLIGNWEEELIKWGFKIDTYNVHFTTYISLPKYTNKQWDLIIFDECHHLSERCLDAIYNGILPKNAIFLSATVNRNHKMKLKQIFKDIFFYKIAFKEAIDKNVLPNPTIYLVPLQLDNTTESCEIIKNKQERGIVMPIHFKDRWKYLKDSKLKTVTFQILCTPAQYHLEICNMIEWYKSKRYLPFYKNKWLQACNSRLKWLSKQKEEASLKILSYLQDKRTLTFCSSIQQTEVFNKNCIHSKNKEANQVLQDFQNGIINHITACDMLNEGCNLKNCQVGVFVSLHSSDILIAQRNGRLLRHENPIFIIPYFVHTREEEIVKDMLQNYDVNKIHTIKDLNELKNI